MCKKKISNRHCNSLHRSINNQLINQSINARSYRKEKGRRFHRGRRCSPPTRYSHCTKGKRTSSDRLYPPTREAIPYSIICILNIQAADQASNTRLLNAIVSLCGHGKKYKLLNDMIVLLAKKHGFLKHAVQAMVQTAMSYIAKLEGTDKTELIDTIRTVTDGKVIRVIISLRV